MISEIDLRDWNESIADVNKAVDEVWCVAYPYSDMKTIRDFIEKVEKHINSNSSKIAAVLRAPVTPSDEYQSAWHPRVQWGVDSE